MKIIKYTHACIRLEHAGGVLVIDPGIWSEPESLLGADAVLVTHEHTDHVDRLRLAGLGAPVYAPAFVPAQASWLKMAEAIEFLQAVRPVRAFAIHDGLLNERGLTGVNGWLASAGPDYRWLAPGESA